MSYYFTCFKKYADFEGRARRKEYWTFTLTNYAIMIIMYCFLHDSLTMLISLLAFLLVIAIPSLAVLVRRLHDVGWSGEHLLRGYIPIFGSIWLLVQTTTDSDCYENAYGECPKKIDIES